MRIRHARRLLHVSLLLALLPPASGAEPVTHGYRDFDFGSEVISFPTAEKPESKLWFNDGIWWGSLWSPGKSQFEIHRLDPVTHTWVTTGVAIDTRHNALSDALWDGERLYVVSHVFTKNAGPAPGSQSGRLFRYSYDPVDQDYTADPGFPVTVNGSKSETLVIDKDSTGTLWVAWAEDGDVKVNNSKGSDLVWGEPFDLPLPTAGADIDDIASIVAFGGDRIGIFWSNQVMQKMFFAVHLDGTPDNVWLPEDALSSVIGAAVADDHINVKAGCDDGSVYAATKTSLDGDDDPLVYLLVRSPLGIWSKHVFGVGSDDHTRPIVVLDGDNDLVHVLASSDKSGKSVIYIKTTDMNSPSFEPGLGTPFIESDLDVRANNVASAKHCITSESGLLALASDQDTHRYLHNLEGANLTGVTPYPTPLSSAVLTRVSSLVARGAFEFRLELADAAMVHAEVYTTLGRRVRSLAGGVSLHAGQHEMRWDGRIAGGQRAAAGVYFLRVRVENTILSERMLLIR